MAENLTPIEEIQRLRNSGKIQEAFILISEILKGKNAGIDDLIEAMRLSILLGENQMAYDIYLTVKNFENFNPQKVIEILLRLKLSLKNEPVPELDNVDPGSSSRWCQSYLADKQDPVYESKIQDCSIDCHDGTVNYEFSSLCLSCNQSYTVHISRSLMVYREFYCPICLARQFIDFSMLKHHLTKSFKGEPIEKTDDYNAYLADMETKLNFDSVQDNRFPILCQYLNVDYTYYLVQLILKRQLKSGKAG